MGFKHRGSAAARTRRERSCYGMQQRKLETERELQSIRALAPPRCSMGAEARLRERRALAGAEVDSGTVQESGFNPFAYGEVSRLQGRFVPYVHPTPGQTQRATVALRLQCAEPRRSSAFAQVRDAAVAPETTASWVAATTSVQTRALWQGARRIQARFCLYVARRMRCMCYCNGAL